MKPNVFMICFFALFALRERGPPRARKSLDPLTFQQWRDHNDHSQGTFSQRYFEITTFTAHNASDVHHAILSIGGESDDFVADGDGDFISLLAQDFNASVFTLEHRYFGTSFPTIASTANYSRYFSIAQALGDLRNFAVNITAARGWSPSTKWLIAGGSYSGMLSSFARQEFPDVFHAAFSSSGVVLASDNYSEFDLQIAISMGQECASVARAVRLEIERLWAAGYSDWILREFGCEGLGDPQDFLFVLADVFSIGPQYSKRGMVCDPLVDTLNTGGDPVLALARFTREVFIPRYSDGNISLSYSRTAMKADENATENTGARAWQWMTCNEVGYWQVAAGRLAVRPVNLTREWFAKQCRDIFGEDHMYPNVTGVNRRYRGLAQNASRVFYTTGSQDPWTWVCITEESGAPKGSIAHTIVGPEMGHCRDWSEVAPGAPPDLVRTQNWERAVFREWLTEDGP